MLFGGLLHNALILSKTGRVVSFGPNDYIYIIQGLLWLVVLFKKTDLWFYAKQAKGFINYEKCSLTRACIFFICYLAAPWPTAFATYMTHISVGTLWLTVNLKEKQGHSVDKKRSWEQGGTQMCVLRKSSVCFSYIWPVYTFPIHLTILWHLYLIIFSESVIFSNLKRGLRTLERTLSLRILNRTLSLTGVSLGIKS